jgi:hypothetical protein
MKLMFLFICDCYFRKLAGSQAGMGGTEGVDQRSTIVYVFLKTRLHWAFLKSYENMSLKNRLNIPLCERQLIGWGV